MATTHHVVALMKPLNVLVWTVMSISPCLCSAMSLRFPIRVFDLLDNGKQNACHDVIRAQDAVT
ncbi:hypothetical protein FIU92_01040 [Ruegeria sp. THAF33]|nr:hypothetical protein FIU92_01040 [Ruegeria sp. THAF33]